MRALLERLWGYWQLHIALAACAVGLVALQWLAGPHPGPLPSHKLAMVIWAAFAGAALVVAVWASRGNRALRRDSHRGLAHHGFRDAAKVSVEHRFFFSAGANVRLVSSTMLYGTLGWIGACASGLRGSAGMHGAMSAGPGLLLGLIAGVVTVPLAAYIALQSRRPVVVTNGKITARHWTGWTRRLALHDDVRLVMREVDLQVFAIEAFSVGKSLHLARVDAREAFALEAQLREAIAETCGVVLSQELVPLSRPGGVPP